MQQQQPSQERPVLVVDVLNAFVRSYCAYPAMNANGESMGGCVGFLKTLKRIINEVQPTAVYLCWEGGGSKRRRSLLPEYKLNRAPGKLNRFYEGDLPDSEENRQHQLRTLLSMLRTVPVCQLYVADCEGDDLVAHLCCGPFRTRTKVIVSSDKDLYQLLDELTSIYNLHKKVITTADDVLKEFGIRAKHFALAKAVCGDRGDNVPGIPGIGFRTALRLFPFLGVEEDGILLQHLIDYSHAHLDESSLYQRVLDHEDVLRRNWQLVYLDGNMVSAQGRQAVDDRIKEHVPKADRIGFIRHLVNEGINDFDSDDFFYAFSCIDGLRT